MLSFGWKNLAPKHMTKLYAKIKDTVARGYKIFLLDV